MTIDYACPVRDGAPLGGAVVIKLNCEKAPSPDQSTILREILQASPALRVLIAEAGVVEARQDYNEMEESLRCVETKLGGYV